MGGVGLFVGRLEGKADEHLVVALHAAQGCGDVLRRTQAQHHVVALTLDFLVGHGVGRKVGHGCAEDGCAARGEELCGGVVHLLRRFHPCDVQSCPFVHLLTDGAQHQLDLHAALEAGIDQGQTHLARRVVADEAHGVDALVGGAGGNEDGLGHRGLLRRCEPVEVCVQHVHDAFRLFHASLALQVGGQESCARLDDADAVPTERVEIVLCGRVGVHVEVHGGRHKHRRFHAQVGRNQHVVGDAVRHLADGGGGGRCDEHGVGPQAERHVRVPGAVTLREKLADDGLRGQCRERDGGDEFLAGGRDDHLHLGTGSDELADDEARLVGSDASGDAEYDFLSFQHGVGGANVSCISGRASVSPAWCSAGNRPAGSS